MNDPLRDACFGSPFGRMLVAGNGKRAAISTAVVELGTESTSHEVEYEIFWGPGEGREKINRTEDVQMMDWKTVAKYFAAAVVSSCAPAIAQAALETLHASGWVATGFGALAASAIGAVLLHFKSPVKQ